MLILLAIAFLIGLGVYYVTILDFEVGTGFTEEKKQAREAEYTIVKREDTNITKFIE